MRRALLGSLLLAAILAACRGAAPTALPAEFPINPCPLGGLTARPGYILVPPGAIAFGYEAWHNETPDSRECGAQSVRGAKTIIKRSDVPSGILPWAATFLRAVRLGAPEREPPEARVLRVDANGDLLFQDIPLGRAEQYGAMGNAFDGISPMPTGRFRLDIVSATGEVIATGQFQIVE